VAHSNWGDTFFSYLIGKDGLETCPVVNKVGQITSRESLVVAR